MTGGVDDGSVTTARLALTRPTEDDLDALHTIYADPRVWTHLPSLRHTEPATTAAMLQRWIRAWERDGLGPWMVRLQQDDELQPDVLPGPVLGHAGVELRGGPDDAAFWNLGYRFGADVHGRGYATEACRPALSLAHRRRPDLPIIAYLLEHNIAAAKVAEKLELTLHHRGPDVGNPDPGAVRLVYADRELTPEQIAAATN